MITCILWNRKNRIETPQGGMAGLVPPTTTGEAPEGDKYQVESDKYKNRREISGKDGNILSPEKEIFCFLSASPSTPCYWPLTTLQ